MFKLQPLLDHLKTKFAQFKFHVNLSVDEQMIPYYGNDGCKQFLRGKAVHFGYKVWIMCSSNRYCYNFKIYCGKKSISKNELFASSQVVMDFISVV